jgi:DNA (cytosine-5)-methyltransferase 1
MTEPLTFGSLFSGIGGIDLGLERAGLICKWQSEIDSYSSRVLGKHWPNVPNHGDITKMQTDQIEKVDLICGGFPCQDISLAGKGAGLKGERSGLFYEFIRIVRGIRPQYLLLENVAALLVRGLDDVLGTLAALGYDCEWHCIPAAAIGAPHRRDRIFILAYSNDVGSKIRHAKCCKSASEKKTNHAVSLSTIMADADGSGLQRSHSQKLSKCTRKRFARTRSSLQRFDKECAQWEFEPGVGRVANGISSRVDRLKGLGNAVVPQIAEWIGLTFFRGENDL